jgi:hypothetical protein
MSVGKYERNALPFSNVVAAGDASSVIVPGKTLNTLQLQLGGTAFTKAMLTMFKLKANAKTVFEGSGAQIDAINAYRGLTTNAAFLDIPFEDLTGMDQLDRFIGAFDTSHGIVNMTTEVTIAGATAPTLKARLLESNPQVNVDGSVSPFAGLIAKTLRYPFAAAAGGDLPLSFPFGPVNGAVIKRVHVFNTGGLMTGALVKENSIAIHESTKAQNEYEQIRNKRVPQANCYTIDFIKDGNVRNAFDTREAKTVEWILSFSGADAGWVLIEYLDRLGNL